MRSSTSSGSAVISCSEETISNVIMRCFADTRHSTPYPIGHPIDHAPEGYDGVAEEPKGFGAVHHPPSPGLCANKLRCLAQPLPKRRRKRAYANRLGPADI